MRTKWGTILLSLSAAWWAAGHQAAAQTGAKASGNWNDPTIWTGGYVPDPSRDVFIGSLYPPGSAATATVTLTQAVTLGPLPSSSTIYLGDGPGTSGTLNLGSNTLTWVGIQIGTTSGGTGAIQESPGGSFAVHSVNVFGSNALTFGANDTAAALVLQDGATATTTAAGNVSVEAVVWSGSTLHLGANLVLANNGDVDVRDTGSVLDMGGHSITSNNFYLGYLGSAPVTVQNQGNINVNDFSVGHGMTYNLLAGDKVGLFALADGASSTLNGTVGELSLSDATAATIAGKPMTFNWIEVGASSLTLHGGDEVGRIGLTFRSLTSVQETNGTGLTLDGTSADSLSIDSTSLDLNFTGTGWGFRWTDPSGGGNWIGTINDLISAGDIAINLPAGGSYQVVDQGGYTYINGIVPASVPEPSSIMLAAMAIAGLVIGRRWQPGRSRH